MGYILNFQEIDRTRTAVVGGKGAMLAELSRIDGIDVPDGFCVTTEAFRRILAQAPSIDDRLDRLSRLEPDDREAIRALSAEVRQTIEALATPDDVAAAIGHALGALGEHGAHAVRSSATAEDLPTASFAGQQDTYLNVTGAPAILRHVHRCWASLFTERAVAYRLRNGFGDRPVEMAVIVQRMVVPQASGVLFTADPLTSNRKVVSIEAGFSLGEDLVSGRVSGDAYAVRDGEIVAAAPARHERPALTDGQIAALAGIGRRIEAHFGRPQDVEWCLAEGEFWILQSRPITTLFPMPAAADGENHVYVSVGHQQMMTDAMKPLGLSLFQLTAFVPMHEAGGRLFVDVSRRLAAPGTRVALLEVMGRADPLIADALQTILDRGDFIVPPADDAPSAAAGRPATARIGEPLPPIDADPAIVEELIALTQASIAALEREITGKSGAELLDFILADLQELKRILFDPRSHQVFMTAMDASHWLNDHLQEWLGETNAADRLTRSVPHNVTSEMGLALMAVADVIRPHPEVVAFLEGVRDESFLDELATLSGGAAARDAIRSFLDAYGMRCVGEIDITRPRWSEHPSALVPMILGNVRNFRPGAGGRRFQRGLEEAATAEQELLARVRRLPDGESRAAEVKRMIDRVRTFIGYREYPKYGFVSRYFVYKQALMAEAERLADAGVLQEPDDVFYLTVAELGDVVRSHHADAELIRERRDRFRSDRSLTPPRVLTSDGEVLTGAYRRDALPAGALAGLPVSAGVIEGRARVILDIARADLEAGDILVTTYTDPSWTPLFVAITGLVTEVGGLMTHGAVIAREYGLPAVVGVQHATELIRDGQRIRVHGTEGYVEIRSG